MGRTERCALATVEAASRYEQPTEAWIAELLPAARGLDCGFGVLGWTFPVTEAMQVELASPIVREGPIDEELQRRFPKTSASPPSRLVEQSLAHPRPLEPASNPCQRVEGGAGAEAARPYFADLAPWGVVDGIGAEAVDATRHGVVMAIPSVRIEEVSTAEERRRALVMARVLAGLRLRLALRASAPEGDAMLAADGRVVHAEAPAKPAEVREALRAAARRIDRARSRHGASGGTRRRADPAALLSDEGRRA
ncbi:MAG TPA: hypothetical protein RMH99_04570 [Sandaracinaceae bacterium LLY-WYZ-13_1]|nr:hypothetical protein [Sandaracinaceae bacterium LLY-WYZ-13_1]